MPGPCWPIYSISRPTVIRPEPFNWPLHLAHCCTYSIGSKQRISCAKHISAFINGLRSRALSVHYLYLSGHYKYVEKTSKESLCLCKISQVEQRRIDQSTLVCQTPAPLLVISVAPKHYIYTPNAQIPSSGFIIYSNTYLNYFITRSETHERWKGVSVLKSMETSVSVLVFRKDLKHGKTWRR